MTNRLTIAGAIRPVCIFLALLGVLACVPLLFETGRNALLRASGESLSVIVTQSSLSFDTSTSLTFHRNGRIQRDRMQKIQIALAIVDHNWATSASKPAAVQASTSSERVQQAVAAVMAQVKATPLPIPATALRFVRDDLPADLAKTLYPGKVLLAKRSGDTLILADEYAQRFPTRQLPLFTVGAGLIALAGLLYFLLARGRRLGIAMKINIVNAPIEIPIKSTAEPLSHLNSLAIQHVKRWPQYNEYEGHCIAHWHGREDCFHLLLVGDEWDAIQPNQEWLAHVEFECGSGLEISADGASLIPALEQINGVNYRLCGQIIHRDGHQVWLDLPWPLLVDLDLPANARSTHIQVGSWLSATGTLQARLPDPPASAST